MKKKVFETWMLTHREMYSRFLQKIKQIGLVDNSPFVFGTPNEIKIWFFPEQKKNYKHNHQELNLKGNENQNLGILGPSKIRRLKKKSHQIFFFKSNLNIL